MANKELFSLGALYPSDFLRPEEQPRCEPVELKLIKDDDGFIKLERTASKECMWGKYWYRSSISTSMRNQLKDVVDSTLDVYKTFPGMLWIDAAGNDGYLLSQVPQYMKRINIDPAEDSFKEEAEKHCDLVIQDYFSANIFKKSIYGLWKVNIFSVVSMFYDLDEPRKFLKDVYEILDDDGLLIIQISYTPLMLKQLEFSNLCHEHRYYYSFRDLEFLLNQEGFLLMDVQLNNTNAGSFRIFAMKDVADITKFGSQTHRDVCNFRVDSIRSYESTLKLGELKTWTNFHNKILSLRKETVDFIKGAKLAGHTIYGYGASTKFNTLLQWFGLDNTLITAIAERNPDKWGLRTVGTNIPIISESDMRSRQPDFLLIGPAHFLSEFVERERKYLEKGGKFIVCMPEFKIIEK